MLSVSEQIRTSQPSGSRYTHKNLYTPKPFTRPQKTVSTLACPIWVDVVTIDNRFVASIEQNLNSLLLIQPRSGSRQRQTRKNKLSIQVMIVGIILNQVLWLVPTPLQSHDPNKRG